MNQPLFPLVDEALQRDIDWTPMNEPVPTALRVLEVRALCRIADSLDTIASDLGASNTARGL